MHEVLLVHFNAMLACRDGLAARDMVQKQALRTRMQLKGGLQTAEGQDATACNGLHKVAEMVLVLAGMGQMRAGAPPGMQERRLFALASRYLSLYIEYEQVAPRALLPNKFAESLVKQLGSKEQLQNSISTDITQDKPQECGKYRSTNISEPDLPKNLNTARGVLPCSCTCLLEPGPPGSCVICFPAATDSDSDQGDGSLDKPSSSADPELHAYASASALGSADHDHDFVNSLSMSMPAAGCSWPWMVPEVYEDSENESDDDATADISRWGWPYAWPPWCPLSLGGQDMAIMMPPVPPLSGRLPVEATARDLEVAYSKQLRHAVQQYVSHRMCLDNLQASISGSRSRPSPHSAYMNLSITCEMCRKRTRETASLLVCDSCELAFHVHCLEKFKATGLADGEHDWICPKCIVRHAGCPQPRLYGRVPSDRTRQLQENHTRPSPNFCEPSTFERPRNLGHTVCPASHMP